MLANAVSLGSWLCTYSSFSVICEGWRRAGICVSFCAVIQDLRLQRTKHGDRPSIYSEPRDIQIGMERGLSLVPVGESTATP